MRQIIELYGISTSVTDADWTSIVINESCPYLKRKCIKVRKSNPNITIGTCTVLYGKDQKDIIICPHRLLERGQIFIDCIHLLTNNEPGNEFHIVPEISIPGGNVDYFLVASRNGKVKDFVGIELQTLDSTGTIWPYRKNLLREYNIETEEIGQYEDEEVTYRVSKKRKKGFGMNWKMTAKTTLMQLHHKVQTFEHINRHLVLVIQDHFFNYIRREFRFDHVNDARIGDPMHIHVYNLNEGNEGLLRLELESRYSTDANGIAKSLDMQAEAKLGLEEIIRLLETKISDETLFTLQ